MPLTFPTMAEQAAAEFNNSKVTVSIATIAKRMGAAVENEPPIRRYTFDDKSILEAVGRGRSHKIKTFYS